MRTRAFFAVFASALLATATAQAHFKLQQPADWLVTDSFGDPMGTGGTQKMNPCGAGTASGMVTQVVAGSTLHVKLTETIPHGGHYRIALVPKWGLVDADVPEPKVTLDASGQCSMAEIESPPVAPVVLDDLWPHTQANAVAGQVWETDVSIPAQTGHATLQIIEFMTPHAPQCFYHHCAQLEIVSPDAGVGDGGPVTIGPDGGVTSTDDAGSTPATAASSDGGGCNATGSPTPSFILFGLFGATVFSMLRRRRRA